jgi:hypothetical protein
MDVIPTWFEGSRLNFAENLLRFHDDQTAIIAAGNAASIASGSEDHHISCQF